MNFIVVLPRNVNDFGVFVSDESSERIWLKSWIEIVAGVSDPDYGSSVRHVDDTISWAGL